MSFLELKALDLSGAFLFLVALIVLAIYGQYAFAFAAFMFADAFVASFFIQRGRENGTTQLEEEFIYRCMLGLVAIGILAIIGGLFA